VVPSKKVYEIRKDLARMPAAYALKTDQERDDWSRLLRADIKRTLARSEAGVRPSEVTPDKVGLEALMTEHSNYGALRHAVDSWVKRMLIARALNEAGVPAETGGKQ
jgi:hypothetical protein